MKQRKIYSSNHTFQGCSELEQNKHIYRPDKVRAFNSYLNLAEVAGMGSDIQGKSKNIRGFLGPGNNPILNSNTLLQFKTKSIVYSFKKVHNLYPLLTKTEYLLKSLFLSMSTLISKPIYLLNHDKIIIRLFVFLSPKLDKYLDTTTRSFRDISSIVSLIASHVEFRASKGLTKTSISKRKATKILIKKLKKIKSIRPKIKDILKLQIKLNLLNAPSPSYAEWIAPLLTEKLKESPCSVDPASPTYFCSATVTPKRKCSLPLAPLALSDLSGTLAVSSTSPALPKGEKWAGGGSKQPLHSCSSPFASHNNPPATQPRLLSLEKRGAWPEGVASIRSSPLCGCGPAPLREHEQANKLCESRKRLVAGGEEAGDRHIVSRPTQTAKAGEGCNGRTEAGAVGTGA